MSGPMPTRMPLPLPLPLPLRIRIRMKGIASSAGKVIAAWPPMRPSG